METDINALLVKGYIENTIYNVDDNFYFTMLQLIPPLPIFKIGIHSELLEDILPFLFPKERAFYYTHIIKVGRVGLKQYFYMGPEFNKIYNFKKIKDLSKKVTEILTPEQKIDIFDSRERPYILFKPYIEHLFDNNEYKFTEIGLKTVTEENLESLPLELNLRIFYEFFKDLS